NYQIEWTYNDEKFYNVDTLRNLAGGEVFFSIINENNCPSPVRSVTIPNNGITVSHTVLDNPNCDGTPGSVRFQISGGTAPYTIFYSGNRVEVPSTIELEIYRESESFNISDDNGCAINEIVTSTITGGETFRLTDSTVTDLNCENTENGGNGRMGQFDGRIATSFTSAILYHADGGQVHGTKFIAMGQRIRAERLEPGDYYWEINGTCPGNPTTIPFTIQDLVSNPPTINETITAIGC